MRPAKLLSVLNREFTSTETGHHTPVVLWCINPSNDLLVTGWK